nr:MAG TPA: hypothetical protein [Caudoviricetes sp.]
MLFSISFFDIIIALLFHKIVKESRLGQFRMQRFPTILKPFHRSA